MFVKRFTHLFVIGVLITLTVIGQTPGTPPQAAPTDKPTMEEAKAKLNAQTFELLDAVIKDIQRLTLPQNRVFLSITAGDLLWQHNEQAARSLFKDAIADLHVILGDPLDAEAGPYSSERMERSQLRQHVLFALGRHDGRMALDLLAETRPQSTEGDTPVDSEAILETQLASIIAANDPVFALDMARKSLAKGFNYAIPRLLTQIRQKDPALAAELASDILTKLKTTNLNTNQEAANVATTVFDMATAPWQSNVKPETKDAKPLLTEPSLRELAELIAAAALDSSSENSGSNLNVASVMPQLEKYAPSRTQQLRRKYAQTGNEPGDGEPFYQSYKKLMETGNAEDFIAAAEKAEPGTRENYYREAAFKLANEDRIDEARAIVTAHISDPEQRKQILLRLDKQVLSSAATKGKMDETRKLLSTVRTIEERIMILTQLATAVAEKGDKKLASQILEEARTLSTDRPRYSRQFVARLMIARAYIAVDVAQGLAILEASIDQLNELIAAGIIVGTFIGEEEVVKDDELLITFLGHLSEMFQKEYGKDLALLATLDFAHTREAMDRFQRFEVRIMARLLVVQCVLMKKEDKSEVDKAKDNLELTEQVKPVLVSP